MPPLKNLRHEKFIREHIKLCGENAQLAWQLASPPGKKFKHENSPDTMACRILKNPAVKARYEELVQQMAKRADITIDKILTDYQEALTLAKRQEKPDGIVNAATAQAKLVGLLRERVEAGKPGDFETMDNISDVIQAIADAAGPEVAMAISKAMGLIEEPNEREADLTEIKPASDAVN